MILKVNTLTDAQVRALRTFLEKENHTKVAKWEYRYRTDPTTQRPTEIWYTFEEDGSTTRLVEVLEPIDFDRRTGFFKVTLEVHETATLYRPKDYDERTRKDMHMLTLRSCLDRLFDILGLFPKPPVETTVKGTKESPASYNGYALPAPVPLLTKPKEEKPVDDKAAAPAQS